MPRWTVALIPFAVTLAFVVLGIGSYPWFGELLSVLFETVLPLAGIGGIMYLIVRLAMWFRSRGREDEVAEGMRRLTPGAVRRSYSRLPDVTGVFDDLCLVLINTPLGHPADPACRWGLPALFWGEPAVGKSERVRATAARAGLRCEVLYPSQEAPDSFSTVPIPNPGAEGGLIYATALGVAAELAKCESGVLFIDEISCASPPVQAALLALILERRCGSLELPPGVRVLGAANPPDVAATGQDLPAPSASRLLHFQISAGTPVEFAAHRSALNAAHRRSIEVGEWSSDDGQERRDAPNVETERRVRAGWDAALSETESRVLAFLEAHPELLHRLPHSDGQRGLAWPNKRGWTYVIHGLATLHCLGLGAREDLERLIVAGSVGVEAASTWSGWQDPLPPTSLGQRGRGGHGDGGAWSERQVSPDRPAPTAGGASTGTAQQQRGGRENVNENVNGESTTDHPLSRSNGSPENRERDDRNASQGRTNGAAAGAAQLTDATQQSASPQPTSGAPTGSAQRSDARQRSVSQGRTNGAGVGRKSTGDAALGDGTPVQDSEGEGALLAGRPDWRRTLESIILTGAATAGAQQTSIRRPSRRALAAGRLAPGPVSRLPVVALIVDTSQSMRDPDINRARTEALCVLRRLGLHTAWWIQAADDITFGPTLLTTSRIESAPLVRADAYEGETDFRPACARLAKLNPKPDVAVYLTDGEGSAPRTAPSGMRFVWALFGDEEPPVPWGTVVRL